MSEKQNLTIMSKGELRAYVLQHRDDEEALQLYLGKVHMDNPNPQIYSPETNVGNVGGSRRYIPNTPSSYSRALANHRYCN